MEGFEKQLNLSEEQQEQFNAFSDIVQPLIVQLAETNDSQFADEIIDATKKFKTSLKEQGIDISDDQVDAFVKSLFDFKEEQLAV